MRDKRPDQGTEGIGMMKDCIITVMLWARSKKECWERFGEREQSNKKGDRSEGH